MAYIVLTILRVRVRARGIYGIWLHNALLNAIRGLGLQM